MKAGRFALYAFMWPFRYKCKVYFQSSATSAKYSFKKIKYCQISDGMDFLKAVRNWVSI